MRVWTTKPDWCVSRVMDRAGGAWCWDSTFHLTHVLLEWACIYVTPEVGLSQNYYAIFNPLFERLFEEIECAKDLGDEEERSRRYGWLREKIMQNTNTQGDALR